MSGQFEIIDKWGRKLKYSVPLSEEDAIGFMAQAWKTCGYMPNIMSDKLLRACWETSKERPLDMALVIMAGFSDPFTSWPLAAMMTAWEYVRHAESAELALLDHFQRAYRYLGFRGIEETGMYDDLDTECTNVMNTLYMLLGSEKRVSVYRGDVFVQ